MLVAGALSLSPASAQAANGLHPRTPVVWDGATCGTVVVRSDQSSINIPYSIPDANDDGMLDMCDDDPTPEGCGDMPPNQPFGEDEVSTSRRHQFFAMCRQHPLDDLLPSWITDEDVTFSSQTETCCEVTECPGEMCPLVDPDIITSEDVLETNEQWEGCYQRINADDDRRPITVDQAAMGIDWDVSSVPAGVYSIEGYTWEPGLNLWSGRPGFIKVVDTEEDRATYPAGALMTSEEEGDDDNIIDGCETITLTGCVDAGEGATYTLWWRELSPDAVEWHQIVADEPVTDGNFEFVWEPEALPPDTSILLRLDVSNGCGTYTAHSPFTMTVGDSCDGGSVFQDGGDDGGEDVTDDKDNADQNSCVDGTGSGEDDDGGGGCGCSTTGFAAGLPLLALTPLLLRRRRRA